MSYYERVAGIELAENFYQEFLGAVRSAASTPEKFNIRFRDLRRINLHRYPYNLLYRVEDDSIRILVVRHHALKPSFGIEKK